MPLGVVLLVLGGLLTVASALVLAALAWRASLARSLRAVERARRDLSTALRQRDRLIARLLDSICGDAEAGPDGGSPWLSGRPGRPAAPGAPGQQWRPWTALDLASHRPATVVRPDTASDLRPANRSDRSQGTLSGPAADSLDQAEAWLRRAGDQTGWDLGPQRLAVQNGLAEAVEKLLQTVAPAALRLEPAEADDLMRQLDGLDDQVHRAQVEANAEIREHNAQAARRLTGWLARSAPAWLALPADLAQPLTPVEPVLAPAAPTVLATPSARHALSDGRFDDGANDGGLPPTSARHALSEAKSAAPTSGTTEP
ncbi:MAG: hypothetical protein LBJ44_03985 [Propionibacteriaceae bacterium]|jgi:hypothetical protein|nr:hypothetical protein [Propionibacteriaceae bacterium]